jgi:hypothetical protein
MADTVADDIQEVIHRRDMAERHREELRQQLWSLVGQLAIEQEKLETIAAEVHLNLKEAEGRAAALHGSVDGLKQLVRSSYGAHQRSLQLARPAPPATARRLLPVPVRHPLPAVLPTAHSVVG